MLDINALFGKKVYFDTNPLIYALSGHPKYLTVMTQLFHGIHQKNFIGFSSELGLAELLVKPIRENDQSQVQTIYALFDGHFLQLLSHHRQCFEIAADIRAKYRLKMPDAIHVATAIYHHIDVLVTADNEIDEKIQQIKIINLNDYIAC